MLRTLKDLFDAIQPPPAAAAPAAQTHALQLATAVLLVEVMRAEDGISDDERQAGVAALRKTFELAPDEIDRLLELAEHTARRAHDFHSFTGRLNEAFSAEQKLQVVELMWQVAYADGHLSAHENHVMWRVADLLHVPHGAYIGAKMRAKAAAG
jgi:uncharacterized tellurite resistance protein B-like protein